MGHGQRAGHPPQREPRVHRITIEEFLALDEAGFFRDVGRGQLIDGEIIEMSPRHLPHASAMAELTIDLGNAIRALGDDLRVLSPMSARLNQGSLPEADIMVASATDDEIVTIAHVRLMVEVLHSSLSYDLGDKRRLYARTGVPEYWVVDVNGGAIIRLHDPEGETYRERPQFAFGRPVPAATIAGLVVDTLRLA